MFTLKPIGYVRSPYTDTADIPKGNGARHDAEGVLDSRTELETGFADNEGVDMLDGTPIVDINPYLSGVPAGEIRRGWLDEAEARRGS
jgi:tRNA (Thr-GGU) A37 N-methylase